ncbi:MAG: hypothetical protein GQ557_01325 [Mycoplasmataceae bacterium]|nr:hypothetical protein [Mycoplasmataceae bacterium]
MKKINLSKTDIVKTILQDKKVKKEVIEPEKEVIETPTEDVIETPIIEPEKEVIKPTKNKAKSDKMKKYWKDRRDKEAKMSNDSNDLTNLKGEYVILNEKYNNLLNMRQPEIKPTPVIKPEPIIKQEPIKATPVKPQIRNIAMTRQQMLADFLKK